MSSVVIDLTSPNGVKLPNTEVPSDCTVQDIVAQMVDHLTLPYMVNSRPVTYSLHWVNQNLGLKGQQTLAEAGVSNGDQLRLLSSEQLPPASPAQENPLPKTSGYDGSATIEVVLSVLDLNTSSSETLSADMPVQNLIQSVAKKYHLPERDELNVQTAYYMKSKALGRVLNSNETLGKAGVPRGDRLAVLRQEIAG